jgi:hypothetical protein
LDLTRIVRRKFASGGVAIVISCASCLSANEQVFERRTWSGARVIAEGPLVTRMRERIVRLRDDDTLRREIRTLLSEDATNFLVSTPEIAGEVREALGARLSFSFNLSVAASAPFETAGGLPKLPAVLGTQCRQEIPKTELDAALREDEGTLVMDRITVEFDDDSRTEQIEIPNLVRGTRFPLVGISEGWLLVRLPAFEAHLPRTKALPAGPFRVNPLRFDPRAT